MATESQMVNRTHEYAKRERTLTCRGVGTGSQSSDWDVRHTIALGSGCLDTFTAPEPPDSCVPGILGRNSMKNLHVLIDAFAGVMFMVGPGGYELRLSPGSSKHDLQKSSVGHLLLPCSEFGTQRCQKSDDTMSFVVGEHFVAANASEAVWDDDDWNCGERAAEQDSANTLTQVGTHSASSGSHAASS